MPNWKNNLSSFFADGDGAKQPPEQSAMAQFVVAVAEPAFADLTKELAHHGRTVTIRNSGTTASMRVDFHGTEELSYRLQGRTFPHGILPFAEIRYRERKGLKLIRVESMIRSGPADYAITDITKEEVIANFLENYMRYTARD